MRPLPEPLASGAAAADRTLRRAPAGAVAAVSAVLVLVVGVADYATGPEISSSVFYLGPVALAAWYAGLGWGVATSVFAAVTWVLADIILGVVFSAPWIPFWNAGVRLGFYLIVAYLMRRLAALLALQRELAETDARTGLANTRRFMAAVEAEVQRTARYGGTFSVVYLDLDGFKGVNDRWGHPTGDRVLEAVGVQLRQSVRETDIPARLGGDEFALLLPATDEIQAPAVVEKLRTTLEGHMTREGWPVGFSMGVVTSRGGRTSAIELVHQADDLMYEVKRSGKGSTAFRAISPVAEIRPA